MRGVDKTINWPQDRQMKPHHNTKHGQCYTTTYRIWTRSRYRNKGKFCTRWQIFRNFLKDMGERPEGHELARHDPNKPFRKSNCYWLKPHMLCDTPTYGSWQNMLQRATNPNTPQYTDYGGRGITVCEKWRTFQGFLDDMGIRPDGTSIDRINNEKGYSPDNCRWATSAEQLRNTRRTHKIAYDGRILCAKDLAKELNITYGRLIYACRKNKLTPFLAIVKNIKEDMLNSDIPIPPQRLDHATTAKEMAVGDSALFDDREKAKGLQQALKKLGRNGCIRKTERGFRTWRTE